MKSILVFIALLIAATATPAQQVVASSGNSGSAAGYTVDWTLGETVIETISGSNHILTQGLHQPKLVATAISVVEFPGVEVKVYPNPTSQFLKIEIVQAGNDVFLYEIFDLTGRKTAYKQLNMSIEEIDMENYIPGIYILNLITTDQRLVKTFRIIKN